MLNPNLNLNYNSNNDVEYKSTRDGYGAALLILGETNSDVVVLTGDLPDSTRTKAFKGKYPYRFFDTGVAEQNMAGVSAGLALSGKIPFMSSFGVFSPGRNWDQIRVSICYSGANVKIVSTHTGLGVGEDGANHQALEDIAITRVLPGMVVIAPGDFEETKKAIIEISKMNGPVYMRLGKQPVKSFTTSSTPFSLDKAFIYKEGSDITVLSTGTMLEFSVNAIEELVSENIDVELIHVPVIKPLDTETILSSIKKTKCAITVEDHQITGGFGSAIAELTSNQFPVPIEMIGMRNSFGESGLYMELYKKYHMHTADIIEAIKKVMKRKG